MCYAEAVVVNHGVLSLGSVCKSFCFAEPVVVNLGVLFSASGCESWCAMMRQWFCIMLCYTESVVVNHVVIC